MGRVNITESAIKKSTEETYDKIIYRLNQKGWHALSSTHEILGVVAEEYQELIEAIKEGDKEKIKQELLDISVACNFGMACIDSKTLDW
jgi:NTP pyrophosphatase (non-canonical NTP hydrolase)